MCGIQLRGREGIVDTLCRHTLSWCIFLNSSKYGIQFQLQHFENRRQRSARFQSQGPADSGHGVLSSRKSIP